MSISEVHQNIKHNNVYNEINMAAMGRGGSQQPSSSWQAAATAHDNASIINEIARGGTFAISHGNSGFHVWNGCTVVGDFSITFRPRRCRILSAPLTSPTLQQLECGRGRFIFFFSF